MKAEHSIEFGYRLQRIEDETKIEKKNSITTFYYLLLFTYSFTFYYKIEGERKRNI